jgi:2,4-dienoyl-CoA reductase-like NADH-dependent reductase (Old Yellow Enzyme family)
MSKLECFCRLLITEAFFQEDAKRIRSTVKMPLVYAGGLVSGEMIENVFSGGFDCLQISQALLHDPSFIQKLKIGEENISGCNHSNY